MKKENAGKTVTLNLDYNFMANVFKSSNVLPIYLILTCMGIVIFLVANKWFREYGQEFRRPCGTHINATDDELYSTVDIRQ